MRHAGETLLAYLRRYRIRASTKIKVSCLANCGTYPKTKQLGLRLDTLFRTRGSSVSDQDEAQQLDLAQFRTHDRWWLMVTSTLGASAAATDLREEARNPAVNLAKVLADENAEVEDVSRRRNVKSHLNCPLKEGDTPARFAVAFSGGGIRSAAVNLGVIQALAKAGILRQVHYMSGVSGGGYILGWLTSWIRRSGFNEVETQLQHGVELNKGGDVSNTRRLTCKLGDAMNRLARWSTRRERRKVQRPPTPSTQQRSHDDKYRRYVEPNPIRFLRRYTSYLTPRMGLGSGDTLAMISIYLRNVILNQTMIFCMLAGIIAAFQLLAPWIAWKTPLPDWAQVIFFSVAILAAALAGYLTGTSVGRLGRNQKPKELRNAGQYSAILAAIMAACLWILLPTAWAYLPAAANGAGDAHGFVAVFITKLVKALYIARMPISLVLTTYGVGWIYDTYTGKDRADSDKEELTAVTQSRTATLLAAIVAMATLVLGTLGIHKWLAPSGQVYVGDWYVMLGLPAILGLLSLVSYIDIGIAGNAFPDAKREWLARLVGYYLYIATFVSVVMVGALRGPLWMHLLFNGAASSGGGGRWWKWLLPGGWLFTVVSGLLAARSPSTGGNDRAQGRVLNSLARVAPAVFLAGVFLLTSWAVYTFSKEVGAPEYLTWVRDTESSSVNELFLVQSHADGSAPVLYQTDRVGTEKKLAAKWELRGACIASANCQGAAQKSDRNVEQASDDHFSRWKVIRILLQLIVFAFTVSGLLLWRLDANEFSLHLFYRNRLARAFLGATNVSNKGSGLRDRIASTFTGFALDDDVPLQELSSSWHRSEQYYRGEKANVSATAAGNAAVVTDCYDGPYPIWGTALNLTTGEDLACQKRKAASFIYSPLYCGWDFAPEHPTESEEPDAGTGFVNTHSNGRDNRNLCMYAYRGTGSCTPDGGSKRTPYSGGKCGPSVGTAMAASGAAISPNWGYHTSPTVAALLAMFNIRVGWWSGNPRREDSWNQYAPGSYYLITKELIGRADDCAKYVYLSDGGHFDNLGIYEMVRRRIKYIIACDADADPNYEFSDLANAVEKCRRDFGVEIEIDPLPIRPVDATKLSRRHFAVGIVNYPSVTPDSNRSQKGLLLYVKSSLTGSEPADVLGQRKHKSEFPHDITANQFFNETQFEAYRALGENMVAGIWEEFLNGGGLDEIPDEQLKLASKVTDLFTYLEKHYA